MATHRPHLSGETHHPTSTRLVPNAAHIESRTRSRRVDTDTHSYFLRLSLPTALHRRSGNAERIQVKARSHGHYKMNSMQHKFVICFLLSTFLMGCQPASSSPEPAIAAHTYIASDASILNPERGFFTPYELPASAGFSPVRATGNTLVHLNIRLDDWRETNLPQDVLDDLDASFANIRDAGVKAIIRFAYNQ